MNAYTHAHELLTADMRDALLNNPERPVDAPGFPGTNTAADLVLDHFSGKNGEADLHELLRCVGLGAQGVDVHLRLAAWVASVANEHGGFHADDLVARWEFAGEPAREEVTL